jgi:hypothetical protein
MEKRHVLFGSAIAFVPATMLTLVGQPYLLGRLPDSFSVAHTITRLVGPVLLFVVLIAFTLVATRRTAAKGI